MKTMKIPLAAVVCLAAVLWAPSISPAGIINPSFETGDLTGWDAMLADHMVVVSGAASEGSYYLTADIQWTYIDMGFPGGYSDWHWQAGAWQIFPIPPDDKFLSADIRMTGTDSSKCGIGVQALTGDTLGPLVSLVQDAIYVAPAPNGFTRYTVDISALSGYEYASISITGGDDAQSIPTTPVEFSVDNIQIVPEPSTLILLVVGVGFGILNCNKKGASHEKSKCKQPLASLLP